jgi:hypothetical protein
MIISRQAVECTRKTATTGGFRGFFSILMVTLPNTSLVNHWTIVINSWTDDGFGFHQKLHALSKSMGHSVIESTKYYYSLVPRLADVLAEHTNEDETIPEVRYESR